MLLYSSSSCFFFHVVVAAAVLLLAGPGLASPVDADVQQWILFRPAVAENFDYRSLAQHYDFRGSYQFFGLLVGTTVEVRLLKALYPGARVTAFALYNTTEPLWVVECNPRDGSKLVTEVARTLLQAHIPVLETYRDPSGWVDFIVKGNVEALHKFPQATIVSVPMSRQVPLPEEITFNSILEKHDLGIEKNPIIAKLIEGVSLERIQKTVEHLSTFYTRLSTSETVLQAQKWIETQYKELGLDVSIYPFAKGYSDNVIAEMRGTEDPSKIIVVGGHYDCRASNLSDPDMRAPGADDNGSGTANVLELARLFTQSGLKFKHTIRFCSWSGEEQGLVGSRAYAKEMREKGVDIIAVLNSDMLGWTLPNTSITLGMKDRYSFIPLLHFVNNITQLYVPDLEIGYSPSCCSDHQSFFEQGYPAVGYFENPGRATDYPHYHQSTDLPRWLNYKQITLISRAIASAAATIAVPIVS